MLSNRKVVFEDLRVSADVDGYQLPDGYCVDVYSRRTKSCTRYVNAATAADLGVSESFSLLGAGVAHSFALNTEELLGSLNIYDFFLADEVALMDVIAATSDACVTVNDVLSYIAGDGTSVTCEEQAVFDAFWRLKLLADRVSNMYPVELFDEQTLLQIKQRLLTVAMYLALSPSMLKADNSRLVADYKEAVAYIAGLLTPVGDISTMGSVTAPDPAYNTVVRETWGVGT